MSKRKLPPVRRFPEGPRDPSLSINAPRPVRYDREVYRDSNGKPVEFATWVTINDSPAEKTGKR